MKKIIVVGAGPRGIAVVLQALHRGLKVTLVDGKPLHTWNSPFLIADMEMRSPITFDLVSYVSELQPFSLAKFLGHSIAPRGSQRVIEECSIKVHRSEFYAHLHDLWNYILPKVTFVPEAVVSVTPTEVHTATQKLKADAIVLTTGSQRTKTPEWIRNTSHPIYSLQQLLEINPTQASIAVVGSGQGAAETVYHFADQGNTVYWLLKQTPEVNQYPAPSYLDWGYRSALGGHYRSLTQWRDRLAYLGKVKAWQPTITPYIASKLETVKYTQITPTSSEDLQPIFEADYIINSTGFNPDAAELPCSFEVPRNDYLPQFPELEPGFRIPATNVHVSGIYAIGFDGPRQASLISAGLTAKEIVETIRE